MRWKDEWQSAQDGIRVTSPEASHQQTNLKRPIESGESVGTAKRSKGMTAIREKVCWQNALFGITLHPAVKPFQCQIMKVLKKQ